MAKKKLSKNKPTKPIKRKPWTPEERLQQIIDISAKSITGRGSRVDDLFQTQIDKATVQLQKLRASK